MACEHLAAAYMRLPGVLSPMRWVTSLDVIGTPSRNEVFVRGTAHRREPWKSNEPVHSRPARDRQSGSPAPSALTHCFRPRNRHALRGTGSPLSRVPAPHGIRIHSDGNDTYRHSGGAEWQARRLDGTGERRAIPTVGRAPVSGLVADEKTARVPDVASGLRSIFPKNAISALGRERLSPRHGPLRP
jgi:hypothetical protein